MCTKIHARYFYRSQIHTLFLFYFLVREITFTLKVVSLVNVTKNKIV